MTIALVLGVVSVALVCGLLWAPVRIHLEIDSDADADARKVQWQVRWLSATWKSRRPGEARERRARAARGTPTKRKRRRRGLRAAQAAMTTPGVSERLGRLVRDLARLIRPCQADGVVVVGLDDPAGTGMLYGAWCALSSTWPAQGRLRLEPDFAQASLRGRARVDWSIVPAAAARSAARFAAAPAVWRAAWRAWRAL